MGSDKMKPCFYSFYCRLPGGERFKDFMKCISAYLRYPKTFQPFAFRSSLRHFLLGGGYGIIVPQGGAEIPDLLYHVTPQKNLDRIIKSGLFSHSNMVFLADSFRCIEKYLKWHQIPPSEKSEQIILLTIDTRLCHERGICICKISRDGEFIAQKIPPEAIVACESFQSRLASDRRGN